MTRTKISVLTDPAYIPSLSHDTPCGHTVHPVVTDYRDPQCPYCRMVNAMYDRKCAENTIKARGGSHERYEKCEWLHEYNAWAKTTGTGVTRKSKCAPKKGIHGNNSSHRAANARLHNTIHNLERIAAEETAWEVARARLRSGTGDPGEGKKERIEHSATNALYLYHGTVGHGFMSLVKKDCARFMRKRGRNWEVAADPDYPESDPESDLDVARKHFKANAAQRDFIATSSVPKVSADVEDKPQKSKRRRIDASIAFNEEVYVRSEADVDDLWPASSIQNGSAPKSTSSIQSILRTASRKIKRRRNNPPRTDPRPGRPHLTRPLIKLNDPRRIRCYNRTPCAQAAGVYSKGLWAVPDDRVNVDTSGSKLGAKHEQWEKYVEDLEEEGEKWKMDWDEHLRDNRFDHLLSDEEVTENRRMDRELDEHLRDNGLAYLVSDDEDGDGAGRESDLSEDFL